MNPIEKIAALELELSTTTDSARIDEIRAEIALLSFDEIGNQTVPPFGKTEHYSYTSMGR